MKKLCEQMFLWSPADLRDASLSFWVVLSDIKRVVSNSRVPSALLFLNQVLKQDASFILSKVRDSFVGSITFKVYKTCKDNLVA